MPKLLLRQVRQVPSGCPAQHWRNRCPASCLTPKPKISSIMINTITLLVCFYLDSSLHYIPSRWLWVAPGRPACPLWGIDLDPVSQLQSSLLPSRARVCTNARSGGGGISGHWRPLRGRPHGKGLVSPPQPWCAKSARPRFLGEPPGPNPGNSSWAPPSWGLRWGTLLSDSGLPPPLSHAPSFCYKRAGAICGGFLSSEMTPLPHPVSWPPPGATQPQSSAGQRCSSPLVRVSPRRERGLDPHFPSTCAHGHLSSRWDYRWSLWLVLITTDGLVKACHLDSSKLLMGMLLKGLSS